MPPSAAGSAPSHPLHRHPPPPPRLRGWRPGTRRASAPSLPRTGRPAAAATTHRAGAPQSTGGLGLGCSTRCWAGGWSSRTRHLCASACGRLSPVQHSKHPLLQPWRGVALLWHRGKKRCRRPPLSVPQSAARFGEHEPAHSVKIYPSPSCSSSFSLLRTTERVVLRYLCEAPP